MNRKPIFVPVKSKLMIQNSTNITNIIRIRQSKRDYSSEKLDRDTIEKIRAILYDNKTGPFGNEIHFQFIEKEPAVSAHKVKLGTYGFISGARYFIAGSVQPEYPFILEDYGFLLEKIILHLTEMNLGTCWLGGTFSRSEFSTVLGDQTNFVIPAITPVGIIKQKNSIRQNIIRWGAKSDHRKEHSELFFSGNFQTPLSTVEVGIYETPLEMVRLAPSASNKQPWRIVMQNGSFHFYLLETPGYSKTIKAVKLQRVDMGIAMAHFELSCKDLRLAGGWQIVKPDLNSDEAQYLVSWVI